MDTATPQGPERNVRDAPARHERALLLDRGGSRFCVKLSEVSEVGRVSRLARTRHAHEAVLGTLVLHGASVPVVDVAYAIGAVSERAEEVRMFVATRSQPVVCLAADTLEGLQTCSRSDARWATHAMIREWLVLSGEPLPLIDIAAVGRVVHLTPETLTEVEGMAQM